MVNLSLLFVVNLISLAAGKYTPLAGAVDPVTFNLEPWIWPVADKFPVIDAPPVAVKAPVSIFTNLWVPLAPSTLSKALLAEFLLSKYPFYSFHLNALTG